MGSVKNWLMDMEQDAAEMTSQEFVDKHGGDNIDVWVRVQWDLGNEIGEEHYLAISKPEGSA
jgi:hypothetical protein|tara:strand:+ start:247 stop:432 length:186 start_codon:yes stop_codon:yes gene_type:complete